MVLSQRSIKASPQSRITKRTQLNSRSWNCLFWVLVTYLTTRMVQLSEYQATLCFANFRKGFEAFESFTWKGTLRCYDGISGCGYVFEVDGDVSRNYDAPATRLFSPSNSGGQNYCWEEVWYGGSYLRYNSMSSVVGIPRFSRNFVVPCSQLFFHCCFHQSITGYSLWQCESQGLAKGRLVDIRGWITIGRHFGRWNDRMAGFQLPTLRMSLILLAKQLSEIILYMSTW